jgi:serine/threonine protein kinase
MNFYKQNTLPGIPSDEERELPPLPQKIGPYKIESLLNRGSMSLLYLGIHPETRTPLVIKVLSPQHVNNPEAVERFLREAHIIAITNHPNIVKVYGEGKWEEGLYIAMEFIHGISLSQFILQQSLSLKRTLDIILQVAYALSHLHTHGVIHRDLKPENILITEDGEIKVIDFGIAGLHKDVEKKKTSKNVMGTPGYMSPEQKEDPSKISFASDIYALGVITYELVLGKLSYGVLNLSLLPKGLRKIVGKALAVSVQERYASMLEFITDVSQYLKSGELEKDRPGSDQIKEVLEVLQKGSQSLSPALLPNWPQMEIGLAKYKGPGQLGLYYDFFRFPDNTYLIFIAETTTSGIEAPIYTGVLRGMLRTVLYELKPTLQAPLRPLPILTKLGHMLGEDYLKEQFSLNLVMLDPLRDQMTFISCGLGSLLHISEGNNLPRKLGSRNAPLGQDPQGEFTETSDSWNAGDRLILHSLETSPKLENELSKAISENLLLSSQRQAEALLRKMSSSASFATQKHPKALLSVQRLV